MAQLWSVSLIKWRRILIVVIAALGTMFLEVSHGLSEYGVGCYNNLRTGSAMSSSQLDSPDLGAWLLDLMGIRQEIGESKTVSFGFPDPWQVFTLGPSNPDEWKYWCSDKRMTSLEIHWDGLQLDAIVVGSAWGCLVWLLYYRRRQVPRPVH